jgi:hypothetical protein
MPSATGLAHPVSLVRRAVACAAALALASGAGALTAPGASAAPAAPAAPAHQITFYVSPDGNDANPGTSPAHPVRTLAHARDLVRAQDQNMTGDITVELMSGTYRLVQPLSLDASDSGTNGYNVVWTAAPGAQPVLSGGQRITGWQLSDPARGIWSAPVPAGLDTRQLYVNGVRAQRAAGPLPVKLTATATGYTASSDAMDSWRNPRDIEFVYPGGAGYWNLSTGGQGAWTEPRCPVASISGTTITMAQPCWDNSNKRVLRTDGSGRTAELVGPESLGNNEVPAYAENAYELLGQPGQWYLDQAASTIYYIPRQGENLAHADVEAPVLQSLVQGQGSAAAPIHNAVFSGIQFAYATWLTPGTPEGFSEIQANYTITGTDGYAAQGLCQFVTGGTCPYGAWTPLPGGVSFGHDQRIQFHNDGFVHLGAAGLVLGDGSQDDVVQGSVFTDISGNGLELGGVDDPEPATAADHTSGNQILDNHLYDLPVEYHGGVAIDVGYAEHTLIAHNQIDHTAYTGISLGWGGWPDKIKQPATPNYSNSNTVSDNVITDTMQVLADGGGIYTQGVTGSSLADGEHISGNVILDSLDLNHAIYTDNGSTFITATGNVLFGNETDWASRHSDYTAGASGDDPLDIAGNYWQQGDPDSSSSNVTEQGNHIITSLAQAPGQILASAGLEPAYRHILTGSFAAPAGPDAPDQIAAFGANGSAYVGWNPVLVDNGSPVRSYTVTASPGGATVTVSAASFARRGYAIVPGLANGTGYTFTVTAANAVGTSAPSLPSAPVTPPASLGAVPGAPTSLAAYADGGNVSLHWNPPASAGGTPLIGYTISAPGRAPVTLTGHTVNWATSSRNIYTTVGGLRTGTPALFQITADNVAGPGAAAAVSVVPGAATACPGAKLALSPSSTTAQPGDSVQVTTTLTNGCSTGLSGADLYLAATGGYQVSSASPASVGDVAAGATATQTWTVTVPSVATAGTHLFATAVFGATGQTGAVQTESAQATGSIALPAASLSAAFDNVGITEDSNTTIGNLDGAGSSFSAQALATDGAIPGATVTVGGVPFTWPNVASGDNDNVVASGQSFDLSGSGGVLSFLLTAGYGPASGTGQVVYSDGTTQPFTLTSPDWHGGCSQSGAGVALYMPYRNRASGQNSLPVCVYDASVALQAGKAVSRVVLPDVSSGVASGSPSLHIFAVTIQ